MVIGSYGGNYADFAKTIINLDKVINSSVLIEKHGDKYKGTSRENRNLEAVFVMVSAFRDGDYVIPVQLEIKKASDVGGRLYLTVAMTKIEASVLGGTIDNNQAFPLIPASITYNLADIFREINLQDGHFLKYLPDGFLSEAQKEAKRMAIEEDTLVTKEIGESIWQRSFYDHIIRDEDDYHTRIRYIEEKTKKWFFDDYYV